VTSTDPTTFAGLTLEELEAQYASYATTRVVSATRELIAAYKLLLVERDAAILRIDLLRKAAGGGKFGGGR
jgi:hypothetical protein